MTRPISVELDFADKLQLQYFLLELDRASRGEITRRHLENSFRALPDTVKAIFGEHPSITEIQKENP